MSVYCLLCPSSILPQLVLTATFVQHTKSTCNARQTDRTDKISTTRFTRRFNSEKVFKMATDRFHNIIHKIQTCGLDFKMEITSFSATIIIKNSLVKDKNGNPLTFPVERQIKSADCDQTRKIREQENVIKSLQSDLQNALYDSERVNATKTNLENVIDIMHNKLEALEFKNVELNKAMIGNEAKLMKSKHQEEKEIELSADNDKLQDAIKKLRDDRNDSYARFKSELALSKKESKEEIKAWRSELGEERKNRIKLENKLEKMKQKKEVPENVDKNENVTHTAPATFSAPASVSLEDEILCTICAEVIHEYVPKLFHGIEINPACDGCQDSSFSSDEADENYEEIDVT